VDHETPRGFPLLLSFPKLPSPEKIGESGVDTRSRPGLRMMMRGVSLGRLTSVFAVAAAAHWRLFLFVIKLLTGRYERANDGVSVYQKVG